MNNPTTTTPTTTPTTITTLKVCQKPGCKSRTVHHGCSPHPRTAK